MRRHTWTKALSGVLTNRVLQHATAWRMQRTRMTTRMQPVNPTDLRDFLALTYSELEDLNLGVKRQRKDRAAAHQLAEERLGYLSDEKSSNAGTGLFSDLEGR